MSEILIVLAPGAEEIETITVADVLVRAGCAVTLAATGDDLVTAGSRGIPLAAHVTLDSVIDRRFDLIYLPGGMGSAETCRDDARIQGLMRRQLDEDRWLALICAAPISLLPQGLGRGRRVTSYPAMRAQIEPEVGVYVEDPVAIDGCLITSRGPGTAMILALSLVRILIDPAASTRVAAEMLLEYPAGVLP